MFHLWAGAFPLSYHFPFKQFFLHNYSRLRPCSVSSHLDLLSTQGYFYSMLVLPSRWWKSAWVYSIIITNLAPQLPLELHVHIWWQTTANISHNFVFQLVSKCRARIKPGLWLRLALQSLLLQTSLWTGQEGSQLQSHQAPGSSSQPKWSPL